MIGNTPNEEGSSINIRYQLNPGDIGYLIYLHGILYAEEYGFDHSFEAYVAENLGKFVKSKTSRERIWIVEIDSKIVGSIAIVKDSTNEAQLRWLLLHPSVRGEGLGKKLIAEVIDFCKECSYSSIFFWTVSELSAASRLYKSVGFKKTEENTHEIWGTVLTEERYDLILNVSA